MLDVEIHGQDDEPRAPYSINPDRTKVQIAWVVLPKVKTRWGIAPTTTGTVTCLGRSTAYPFLATCAEPSLWVSKRWRARVLHGRPLRQGLR